VAAPAILWQFDTMREDADAIGKGRHPRVPAHEPVVAGSGDATDRDLVERLCAGDERALELVFDRHLAGLVRFAEGMLPGRSDSIGAANDIVSDVLVTLWERRATLGAVQHLRAYLYRAVRYRALNHRRSERRTRERYASLTDAGELPGIAQAQPTADMVIEVRERGHLVWRTVQEMREPLRTIAVLRWSHGLSFAEIGEIVGTSDAVARTHASRALAILRETLPELLR
jgi:RNA polymerase sigma-70 factor (ECF subfamily)